MEARKLSNGMRVVLVPTEAESIAFGLFVGSGSRHETELTAGISHFIEHMLFKGTPSRSPLKITQAIEGRGGNFNACTSEESTIFYAHMPYEYMEEAVDIIADMFLNATIPDDEFEREKNVVLEEIKMYADEPDSVAMENLQRSLFMKSRLGSPVAGSAVSLLPLVPQDLRNYISTHYRADNTVAVIVGRFDDEIAYNVIERKLGGCRRKSVACKRDGNPLKGKVRREIVAAKDVQQAQLALGYRTFGLNDDRKYAVSVLDSLMGRGMSSRLFQEVREKRGLSYDISSRMQFFDDAGMWTITAGLDPSKASLALKTVDRELKRVCERRISSAELKRTKEYMVGNFRLSNERVLSKMFYYGASMLAFNRAVDPQEQVERIKAVTAQDIINVANDIIRPENRAVSWVLPKTTVTA